MHGILLAAGMGSRYAQSIGRTRFYKNTPFPKHLQRVDGASLLEHASAGLATWFDISDITILVHPSHVDLYAPELARLSEKMQILFYPVAYVGDELMQLNEMFYHTNRALPNLFGQQDEIVIAHADMMIDQTTDFTAIGDRIRTALAHAESGKGVVFRDTTADEQFLYLIGRVSNIFSRPAVKISLPLRVFNINTKEDRFEAEHAMREWSIHRQKER